MKIAFIYDAAYPWVMGGAERRVYELAIRLVKRGHEVHWYSIGWWWPEEGRIDLKKDGIHYHGVSKPQELYSEDRRSIKEALQFSINLIRPLMRENFDVVDCQGFPFFSSFVAKLHSVLGKSHLIITLHEVWGNYWYEYLGRTGILGKLVERSMLALTNRFITVSEKTERDLQKIKPTNNSTVIPNGIDYQQITNIQPTNNLSDIMFAGRLIKEKRVELLIQAVSILTNVHPDIRCLIIGDGPERDRLEKMVEDLKLTDNITFHGFMDSYNELIGTMKSSKIFVLPSEREGFGMVVVEANASGLPVIVVDYPMNAAKELIFQGENGYIADPTPEDLAKNMIKSLENRLRMREKSISISKDYDWDRIVDSLETIYKQLIN